MCLHVSCARQVPMIERVTKTVDVPQVQVIDEAIFC